MAGSKINLYSTSYTSITNMQQTLDATRYGYFALNLTNMSTSAAPAIASGSKVEIDGSLYQFSTVEPISTTGVASTTAGINNYVMLVPSSSQVTAQFTTTVPTFVPAKQGWYYNSTSNRRYVGFCLYDSTLGYYNKLLFDNPMIKTNIIAYTDTSGTISIGSSSEAFLGNHLYGADILSEFSSWGYTPKQTGMYSVKTTIKVYGAAAPSTITPYLKQMIILNSTVWDPASTSIPVIVDTYIEHPSFRTGSINYNIYMTTADTMRIFLENLSNVTGIYWSYSWGGSTWPSLYSYVCINKL